MVTVCVPAATAGRPTFWDVPTIESFAVCQKVTPIKQVDVAARPRPAAPARRSGTHPNTSSRKARLYLHTCVGQRRPASVTRLGRKGTAFELAAAEGSGGMARARGGKRRVRCTNHRSGHVLRRDVCSLPALPAAPPPTATNSAIFCISFCCPTSRILRFSHPITATGASLLGSGLSSSAFGGETTKNRVQAGHEY